MRPTSLILSQRHKLVKGCASKSDAAVRENVAKSDDGSSDNVDDTHNAMNQ